MRRLLYREPDSTHLRRCTLFMASSLQCKSGSNYLMKVHSCTNMALFLSIWQAREKENEEKQEDHAFIQLLCDFFSKCTQLLPLTWATRHACEEDGLMEGVEGGSGPSSFLGILLWHSRCCTCSSTNLETSAAQWFNRHKGRNINRQIGWPYRQRPVL